MSRRSFIFQILLFALRWLDTVFSGSVPPKFEHKLRRHKQRFGKIATTVVLDKDENLLWSGLQWHRSCHSNEMTPSPILLQQFSALGTLQNRSQELFSPIRSPRCSWSLSKICKSVIEIFCEEAFMVRNTLKTGQPWCLTVICTKRSAFDMQFHLIVVSIFSKACVKDHGDASSRLLERRIWLVCIGALLLAVI